MKTIVQESKGDRVIKRKNGCLAMWIWKEVARGLRYCRAVANTSDVQSWTDEVSSRKMATSKPPITPRNSTCQPTCPSAC